MRPEQPSPPPSSDPNQRAREPARDGGPVEAAHYLTGAIADLSRMARQHRLEMLSYLLDMAQLEADEIVRRRGQIDRNARA